jgi:hypothetical protein
MIIYNKVLRNIKVMLLSLSESEVDSLELTMLGCIEAVVLVGVELWEACAEKPEAMVRLWKGLRRLRCT